MITKIFAAIAFCFIFSANLGFADELGLAERRAIAAYQEKVLPAYLGEIKAAAGTDIPVDVDWTKIALPGKAQNYAEDGFWTDIYFKPLTKALASVGADAMGKDAIKAKLKKIVVTYDKDTAPVSAYEDGVKFAGGVLTINFAPYANTSDIEARTTALKKVIEANL